MADEEQLSILKQGVEVWNKWRANSRTQAGSLGYFINLSGADLRSADLSGANPQIILDES